MIEVEQEGHVCVVEQKHTGHHLTVVMTNTRVPCKEAVLFGGAMTTQIPADMVDGSRFRPIPDHQEVFVKDSDRIGAPESLIIELLQADGPEQDPDALSIEWQFNNLAMENRAVDQNILFHSTHQSWQVLLGTQTISSSPIYFCVALLWLEQHRTIILITMHISHPHSTPIDIESQFHHLFVDEVVSNFRLHDPSIFIQ